MKHLLPAGLVRPLPCCRRLASLRMSMISVANSRALKRANFCRPYEEKTDSSRLPFSKRKFSANHGHSSFTGKILIKLLIKQAKIGIIVCNVTVFTMFIQLHVCGKII